MHSPVFAGMISTDIRAFANQFLNSLGGAEDRKANTGFKALKLTASCLKATVVLSGGCLQSQQEMQLCFEIHPDHESSRVKDVVVSQRNQKADGEGLLMW
jgi:hypothetical protein